MWLGSCRANDFWCGSNCSLKRAMKTFRLLKKPFQVSRWWAHLQLQKFFLWVPHQLSSPFAQLKQQAVWRRRSTIRKRGSNGDKEVDAESWRQTLEEVSEGWLSGPFYNESQVSSLLQTEDWICTRRFSLQQPGKLRLTDDGLDSGLNSAFSSFNKLQLMDMGSVVTLVNIIMQSVLSGTIKSNSGCQLVSFQRVWSTLVGGQNWFC